MRPAPMSHRPRRATAALVLALCACAGSRGFDRGALARELRQDQKPVVTDDEIAKVLAVRPQLPVPLKVAVYFRPNRTDRWYGGVYGSHQWSWTGEDREAVLRPLDALVQGGRIAQLISIPEGVVAGDDLRSIRLGSARVGADAVVVVTGAGQLDRYNDGLSILYATVVGMFFVPGTHADAVFGAGATMWDVRNEYLYAAAEAEGVEQVTGTPFTVADEHVMRTARAKGMRTLGEELGRRLAALTAPAPGAPRAAASP